jgi:hypothetical protein
MNGIVTAAGKFERLRREQPDFFFGLFSGFDLAFFSGFALGQRT